MHNDRNGKLVGHLTDDPVGRSRHSLMPTEADLDAASVYTSVMEEAKFRALSVNTLTGSQIGLPVSLLREFCFLQLRMLCELIALGCLVAHGDIKETRSLV
jgi:hypothetical protein